MSINLKATHLIRSMSSSAFTISLMINQCKLTLTMSLMVFGLVFIDSLHKHIRYAKVLDGRGAFQMSSQCRNNDAEKVAGTDVLGIDTGFGDNLMI